MKFWQAGTTSNLVVRLSGEGDDFSKDLWDRLVKFTTFALNTVPSDFDWTAIQTFSRKLNEKDDEPHGDSPDGRALDAGRS